MNNLNRLARRQQQRFLVMKGRSPGLSTLAAVAASQPIPPEEVTHIMLKMRLYFEALRKGDGELRDWSTVADMVNLGLIRSEAIDPALQDLFRRAGEAMLECQRIHREHGKYGFTGPGLIAVTEAIDAYDELLKNSTPRQMRDAALEADRRVHAGHVVTPP